MNNIHKVIFNKTTQQFVVVSELAKSAGKAKTISADTLDISLLLQNFSEKRPLVDVGNQVNAQHIDITSRSGDITATHTAFTSRDEQGKRLKDSSITFDSAKRFQTARANKY